MCLTENCSLGLEVQVYLQTESPIWLQLNKLADYQQA